MLWSKAKTIEDAGVNQPECNGKAEQPDTTLDRSNHETQYPGCKDETKQSDVALENAADQSQYPGLKIVLPVVISACGAVFLAALDRTIVGITIPAVSNEFDSFDDIAWYESAYLLTNCAFQLPLGKVYTFFSSKWVFIAVVVLFEIGSIICAVAPTSSAFIVGRAIAGAGSAGTTTGAVVIFTDLLPLQKRPKYQGLLGATFGLASIAGPLLGGVFTTRVDWRWCFWINLPVGGVALAALVLILPAKPPPRKHSGESFGQRVKQFDPVGTILLLPGLVLLVLALQWGGNGAAWEPPKVVATLVAGILLLVAFGVSQLWSRDNGTVPPRILGQRSIAAAAIVASGFGSVLFILAFYLPIWYQAVQEQSAVHAGLRLLPYFLATTIFVIASGIIVSKIGYYTPVLIVGTALIIVGCGLLTTLQVDTSRAITYGFQVVASAGLGLSLAQPNNVCQTVLSREDIPIGVTIVTFAQFLSGTIFITVCQAVLSNTLISQLSTTIPGLDAASLSTTGVTDLMSLVPKDKLQVLFTAYNLGICNVFYIALAMSCLAFVASFFLEWRTMKKQVQVAEV
ncbi:hypothetical protein MBLNU459_g4943t1 [Dothideomycetes sp. NU459]